MTEKEKAKAYDKAIERAKKLYGNGIAEEIFPELKESDDDRLKKAIIEFFESEDDNTTYSLVRKKDIIAWLEKQGEQKPTLPKWKYKKDNTPLLRDSIILNKYGGVAKSPSGAIVSDAWVLDYDELAKLPKEEKIEPKFKVGDWIISSVLGTARIIGVNDSNEFQLEYTDGKQEFSSIDYVNYAYDKWTINNAKDNDVLALSWLEDKNLWEKIIIFKKYHSEGVKGICSMPCVDGYGNTFKNGKMAFTDEEVPYYSKTWTWNLHPATKEQRDLLFQKIKETGYGWDVDKKELKKLEKSSFHEGDWVVRGDTIAQILDVQEQYYVGLDTNGKDFVSSRFLNSDKIHLWTIEDVRDGDILACNEEILLFKSYSALQGRISLYCWYNGQTNNFHSKEVIDILLTTTNKVCPATKEQRDTLMKAMNDAEYECDAEKKELKKEKVN